jgi:hypothetical protein
VGCGRKRRAAILNFLIHNLENTALSVNSIKDSCRVCPELNRDKPIKK